MSTLIFQHDMAYEDFKDLAKRTASDNVLRDKAFNIAKNPKYDGYQGQLASMVYKFFDKKAANSGFNIYANKSAFSNEKLAEILYKPVTKKLKKIIVYSGFKDNIWGADIGDLLINRQVK